MRSDRHNSPDTSVARSTSERTALSPPVTVHVLPALSDIGEEASTKGSSFDASAFMERERVESLSQLPPRGPTYASRAQMADFARRERAAARTASDGAHGGGGGGGARSRPVSTESVTASGGFQQLTSLDCATADPTTANSHTCTPRSRSLDEPHSASDSTGCASQPFADGGGGAPWGATAAFAPHHGYDVAFAHGPTYPALRRNASAASFQSSEGTRLQRYSSTGYEIQLPMPPKQNGNAEEHTAVL